VHNPRALSRPLLDRAPSFGLATAFGAALIPVLFAYGGWQTANFLAGEIKEPRKNLSRALLIGVAGVVALYVGVNVVCVRALGPGGLAATRAPATAVMRLALGQTGATMIAIAITISTLGFLSQSILTAPRVYFAMAESGVFFRAVAYISSRTRVPVVAIVLQSVWTAVIALSGRYEQILNYVVAMDFLFFGLTASCLFVFRGREKRDSASTKQASYRVPGHPVTTLIFITVSWLVVINTIFQYPENSLIGVAILLLGLPVYFLWQRQKASLA
jgi:APA family basic amino acid/polyamine antiporter